MSSQQYQTKCTEYSPGTEYCQVSTFDPSMTAVALVPELTAWGPTTQGLSGTVSESKAKISSPRAIIDGIILAFLTNPIKINLVVDFFQVEPEIQFLLSSIYLTVA